ncbi:MAG: alpha-2-macroglobulin, partial [Burkholderiales bacterium]|nr:alpha-2-macroglobulin [Burkholderiales bacterium]
MLLGFAAVHGRTAEVELFSPQGEVKAVRQVAVRFSAPMVAFGDARPADPFDIDCPEPGAGRWADHRNWVYDFTRDLPAGVVCTFTPRQDLRSLAGEPVAAEPYRFSTGGPAVLETLPYAHTQIEEEQAFILVLDAPVEPESVLEHAWCDAAGIEERIGVRLLAEDDRRRLLEGRRDFIDRILQMRLREGRLAPLPRDADPEAQRAAALEQLPLVVLHCARRLPAESKLRLVWGAGIESVSGVATSSDQVLEFGVRPAFTAQFSCQRAGKDGGCLPFAPLRLSLSAPIARAVAQKIVLRGPERTYPARLPDPEDGGEWVSEVRFDGPFREQAQYRLEIPADLRDDAGRRLGNQKRFPLTIATDAAPPLAKFPARFGIIEAKAAVLPVTLRNVEAQVDGKVLGFGDGKPIAGGVLRLGKADARTIVDWLKRVEDHQSAQWLEAEDGEPGGRVYAAERSILSDAAGVRKSSVPKAEGARTFEGVGSPLKQPGFYVVELASPKLGAALLTGSHPAAKGGEVYHVSTAALVTNLSVHFKQGRESSLVWVTALDSGRPVASAQVSVQDCSGKEYWKGVTDAQGLVRSAQALPARDKLPGCRSQWDRQYVVLARHGNDV